MTRRKLTAVVAGLSLVASCSGTDDSTERASWLDGDSGPVSHVDGHLGLDDPSVMGRPDRIIAGPQGNEGQFIVECTFSHVAADDPILHPGEPGASHLHAFFGNVEASANAQLESMLEAETTCDDVRDTAAYWVPVLMDGSNPIEPVHSVAYYRAGIDVDPESVEAYPPGLMMIAGDPLAGADQPVEIVAWSCGAAARRTEMPPVCPPGTELRLSVTFPDCWDGRNLDVPGHRRHVHYSKEGKCPSSHPVSIPQLVFAVNYPVNGDISHLRLSSGTLGSGHADFINAWDQEHLEHEVELCIRQQNVCGISSGRRSD